MITLFIDSSRKSLSVALVNCDKLLFVSNVDSHSKHSNFLMNEIKNILNKCNISIYNVDNFVVLNGPGSFTGIRVGVTIAKTICWALSKKLYQLNNLEALKVGVQDEVVICVIPDKVSDSYVGIYTKDNKFEDYTSITSEFLKFDNKSITIVSLEENDFANTLKNKLENNNDVKIRFINQYDYLKVVNYALSKESINPHLAEPVYLKKIDAEKK